jgi:hypothetical protein
LFLIPYILFHVEPQIYPINKDVQLKFNKVLLFNIN